MDEDRRHEASPVIGPGRLASQSQGVRRDSRSRSHRSASVDPTGKLTSRPLTKAHQDREPYGVPWSSWQYPPMLMNSDSDYYPSPDSSSYASTGPPNETYPPMDSDFAIGGIRSGYDVPHDVHPEQNVPVPVPSPNPAPAPGIRSRIRPSRSLSNRSHPVGPVVDGHNVPRDNVPSGSPVPIPGASPPPRKPSSNLNSPTPALDSSNIGSIRSGGSFYFKPQTGQSTKSGWTPVASRSPSEVTRISGLQAEAVGTGESDVYGRDRISVGKAAPAGYGGVRDVALGLGGGYMGGGGGGDDLRQAQRVRSVSRTRTGPSPTKSSEPETRRPRGRAATVSQTGTTARPAREYAKNILADARLKASGEGSVRQVRGRSADARGADGAPAARRGRTRSVSRTGSVSNRSDAREAVPTVWPVSSNGQLQGADWFSRPLPSQHAGIPIVNASASPQPHHVDHAFMPQRPTMTQPQAFGAPCPASSIQGTSASLRESLKAVARNFMDVLSGGGNAKTKSKLKKKSKDGSTNAAAGMTVKLPVPPKEITQMYMTNVQPGAPASPPKPRSSGSSASSSATLVDQGQQQHTSRTNAASAHGSAKSSSDGTLVGPSSVRASSDGSYTVYSPSQSSDPARILDVKEIERLMVSASL